MSVFSGMFPILKGKEDAAGGNGGPRMIKMTMLLKRKVELSRRVNLKTG